MIIQRYKNLTKTFQTIFYHFILILYKNNLFYVISILQYMKRVSNVKEIYTHKKQTSTYYIQEKYLKQ